MSPTISIITVTLNASTLLEKTIQSVLSQTYQPLEYIVIDGRSTDNSAQVIQRYADNIDYWVSEPDEGISDAFNKGILASSGEWVQFLNAGDEFTDTNAVTNMAKHMDDQYIVSSFAFYSDRSYKTIPKVIVKNSQSLAKKAWLSHQGTFVKRCVFDETGLFNVNYKVRMDYEFWLRALKQFDFTFVSLQTVKYDGGGISSINKTLFYREERMANCTHLSALSRHYWNIRSGLKRIVKGILRRH